MEFNTWDSTPGSVKDCLEKDDLALELKNWSSKLETIGNVLLTLLIIGGIILSVVGSFGTEIVSSDYYGHTRTETEFQLGTFFTSLIPWIFYAVIEYCFFHVLVLLISAAASITHQTKVSAKLAEYTARKTFGEFDTEVPRKMELQKETIKIEKTKENKIKCPNCKDTFVIDPQADRFICRACGYEIALSPQAENNQDD